MLLKIPVTPPEIDPGTVRLIAQRLNHYANPGPQKCILYFAPLQLNVSGQITASWEIKKIFFAKIFLLKERIP
jgi:hypothetical protein